MDRTEAQDTVARLYEFSQRLERQVDEFIQLAQNNVETLRDRFLKSRDE